MSLRTTYSPTVPGREAASYKFGQYLHTVMVIGKCTDVSGKDFFGWGEVFEGREPRGRIFPWKNLSWGKKNSMKGANDFRALFEKKKK